MRPLLLALLLTGLVGCNALSPYKLDIPQGNAITQDQVAKLKLGMTQAQVRFVLGSPLLQDAFHPNRWDFQYYESRAGVVSKNKRYYVLFEGDRVVGMGGETLAAGTSVAIEAPEDPRAAAKAATAKEGQPQ